MNEKFSYGEPVEANVGGTVQLAFVTGGPHNADGEQKYDVTSLDGSVQRMAYTADKTFGGGFFTKK